MAKDLVVLLRKGEQKGGMGRQQLVKFGKVIQTAARTKVNVSKSIEIQAGNCTIVYGLRKKLYIN